MPRRRPDFEGSERDQSRSLADLLVGLGWAGGAREDRGVRVLQVVALARLALRVAMSV